MAAVNQWLSVCHIVPGNDKEIYIQFKGHYRMSYLVRLHSEAVSVSDSNVNRTPKVVFTNLPDFINMINICRKFLESFVSLYSLDEKMTRCASEASIGSLQTLIES